MLFEASSYEPVDAETKEFFAHLEQQGEAGVRADLADNRVGSRKQKVLLWLELKEQERREQADELTLRNVIAAEDSAAAAKLSADAADRSARLAGWALTVSIVAAIVAAAAVGYRLS